METKTHDTDIIKSFSAQSTEIIKQKKEQIIWGAVVLVAVIILFGILSKLNRQIIIWIINALLFGFGLWCIFIYPIRQRINKKKLTELVSAIVSDVKEIVHTTKNETWRTYFTTYEFKFRGKTYKVQSSEESEEKSLEGMDTQLLIDPDEPTEIYEIGKEKSRIEVMKFVGLFFIVCGIFMLLNNFV